MHDAARWVGFSAQQQRLLEPRPTPGQVQSRWGAEAATADDDPLDLSVKPAPKESRPWQQATAGAPSNGCPAIGWRFESSMDVDLGSWELAMRTAEPEAPLDLSSTRAAPGGAHDSARPSAGKTNQLGCSLAALRRSSPPDAAAGHRRHPMWPAATPDLDQLQAVLAWKDVLPCPYNGTLGSNPCQAVDVKRLSRQRYGLWHPNSLEAPIPSEHLKSRLAHKADVSSAESLRPPAPRPLPIVRSASTILRTSSYERRLQQQRHALKATGEVSTVPWASSDVNAEKVDDWTCLWAEGSHLSQKIYQRAYKTEARETANVASREDLRKDGAAVPIKERDIVLSRDLNPHIPRNQSWAAPTRKRKTAERKSTEMEGRFDWSSDGGEQQRYPESHRDNLSGINCRSRGSKKLSLARYMEETAVKLFERKNVSPPTDLGALLCLQWPTGDDFNGVPSGQAISAVPSENIIELLHGAVERGLRQCPCPPVAGDVSTSSCAAAKSLLDPANASFPLTVSPTSHRLPAKMLPYAKSAETPGACDSFTKSPISNCRSPVSPRKCIDSLGQAGGDACTKDERRKEADHKVRPSVTYDRSAASAHLEAAKNFLAPASEGRPTVQRRQAPSTKDPQPSLTDVAIPESPENVNGDVSALRKSTENFVYDDFSGDARDSVTLPETLEQQTSAPRASSIPSAAFDSIEPCGNCGEKESVPPLADEEKDNEKWASTTDGQGRLVLVKVKYNCNSMPRKEEGASLNGGGRGELAGKPLRR